MPALRPAIVTASYQILGSTTPQEWMDEAFQDAQKSGLVESARTINIRPIHGSTDFFNVVFVIDVGLDANQSLEDLFRDAKAITDEIVSDTDTVVEEIQFTG